MRVIETEARETADRKAKEILACAIQRYAGDYVGEQTVTAVTLPSEDMKGRIIGREGRNIRALEAATGVDLIIDDTPETVILSAYSPIRRQVARMALERLISGRAASTPPASRTSCTSASRNWKCRSARWANRPPSTRACTASTPTSSVCSASQVPHELHAERASAFAGSFRPLRHDGR